MADQALNKECEDGTGNGKRRPWADSSNYRGFTSMKKNIAPAKSRAAPVKN